jgi:hypothetical protein
MRESMRLAVSFCFLDETGDVYNGAGLRSWLTCPFNIPLERAYYSLE